MRPSDPPPSDEIYIFSMEQNIQVRRRVVRGDSTCGGKIVNGDVGKTL